MSLKDKTIVLGVTGGIAAYKALELTSLLVKAEANVKVIMTKSATEFVTPLSFQSISKNPVAVDTFEEPKSWEIRHISLAKQADLLAIVPCTANIIGKLANGIADDMLSTTTMATKAPVLIAPAMNTNMYENVIVQDNIKKLMGYGYSFIEPTSGRLACGDIGKGKLCSIEAIFSKINEMLDDDSNTKIIKTFDLTGKKVVITAGATMESLDPVRFITNHSTGKMGFALAQQAVLYGAEVTLIAARNTCSSINGVNQVNVTSTEEMQKVMFENANDADIIIMAAAVSDFKPCNVSGEKIKKNGKNKISIDFELNPDILKELGEKYSDDKVIVGFAMETQNLIENARQKCLSKKVDFIVANNLKTPGAGFGTDTNVASIIDKNGECTQLSKMPKTELAEIILEKASSMLK